MLASILFSTVEPALVHALGPDWPAPLQLFWRQSVALVLLLPFILPDPVRALKVARPGVMLFRSVAAMTALLLSIYAFSHLPIATANALSFTKPIWIVLLAALVLKERVDLWSGSAVLLGFAGVLVLAQPGADGGDLLAKGAILASALLFAGSFTSIKSMTGDNRTTTILIYGVLFGLLISAGPAIMWWRTPTFEQGVLLASLGVTSLCAFGCLTQALRRSDAAELVGLDYLRLPLTALLGFTVFGEELTGTLLAGSGLVIAAAILIMLRGKRWQGGARSDHE